MFVRLPAAVVLLLASAATAQITDVEVAKQQFQTGQLYYERGEFDKALAAFQEAYRLAQRADLQYNIAQAHERLLMFEEAVVAYRAYLEGKPDAPDRKFVESRIEFLEKQLAEKQTSATAPAPPTPAEATPAQPAAAQPHVVASQQPAAMSSSRDWQRTAGWVALGVGGVFTTAGVIFGVIAGKKASELEDANTNAEPWSASKGIQEDGERAETLQIVGLAVGGAGLLAGALLLWVIPPTSVVSAGPAGVEVHF